MSDAAEDTPLVGDWKQVRSENFEAFLKFVGASRAARGGGRRRQVTRAA